MHKLIQTAATGFLGTLMAGITGCIYVGPPRHHYVEREVIVEDRPPAPVVEREVVITDGDPPPARVEVVTPRPRYEAVWIRGHWEPVRSRRGGWIWVGGHWD